MAIELRERRRILPVHWPARGWSATITRRTGPPGIGTGNVHGCGPACGTDGTGQRRGPPDGTPAMGRLAPHGDPAFPADAPAYPGLARGIFPPGPGQDPATDQEDRKRLDRLRHGRRAGSLRGGPHVHRHPVRRARKRAARQGLRHGYLPAPGRQFLGGAAGNDRWPSRRTHAPAGGHRCLPCRPDGRLRRHHRARRRGRRPRGP